MKTRYLALLLAPLFTTGAMAAGYTGHLTEGFLGANYQDIFVFAVLILVLLFRPNGLMGERQADRA